MEFIEINNSIIAEERIVFITKISDIFKKIESQKLRVGLIDMDPVSFLFDSVELRDEAYDRIAKQLLHKTNIKEK